MAQSNRFTIYDAMDKKGLFDTNPANVQSRDSEGASLYKGPIQYPKMFYHPLGETRVLKPATAEMTPFGPKMLGEQREIIHKVVHNAEEEKELRSQGWHDHPAKAIKASGKEPPPVSSETRVVDLEGQIAALQAALEEQKRFNEELEAKAGHDSKVNPLLVTTSPSKSPPGRSP